MSLNIPRRMYADLYGPTVGDRGRLADSELIIEVEKDFTVYGDEITFGGGNVIRDGMGWDRAAVPHTIYRDTISRRFHLGIVPVLARFLPRTPCHLRVCELLLVLQW